MSNFFTSAVRRLFKTAVCTLLLCTPMVATAAEPADAKAAKSDKAPAEKASPAKTPNTYTVATEPLNVNIELGATVEARNAAEIAIVPEQWSELVVAEAAEHGARVQKDGVLVKFDTRSIDRTIRDLEAESRINELSLKQTREALALLKKSAPLQLAEVERAAKQANEDFKEYLEKGRPRTLEDIEFQQKSVEQYVANQEEELKQLEKMYKADDLVADTEEIVLKRTRFQVDMAHHQHKQFLAQREWQLTYGLPRMETGMKNAVTQSSLNLQRAQAAIPQAIVEQGLTLAKLEYEDGKKKQRLAELKRDRDRMTVRSPAEGVVYYGRATRGTWPGVEQAGAQLAVGNSIRPHQVLMSIVDPKTARLRATVEESQLRQLRQGMRGTFRPTIDPKQSLTATMGTIMPVPIATGRYDAEIDADVSSGKGLPAPLLPGMAGQVRFSVYSSPKALVVPAATVKTDDDEQSYVMLVDAEGNSTRRDVKIGEKMKDKVEILEGLKAGDKILAEEKK